MKKNNSYSHSVDTTQRRTDVLSLGIFLAGGRGAVDLNEILVPIDFVAAYGDVAIL